MKNLAHTLTDIEAANALKMDRVESDVRPLGSFEELLWLLDQGSPRHFSLAAEIEGHATVGDWRTALHHVQRRHPFFSVCIEKNARAKPHFRRSPQTPIPIRVVRVDASQPNWLTEMQTELATPFDPGRAPLVRAVLMHEPHRATLILTAHHSIADGLSLSFAIRDTLLALSGTPMEPLMVTPPIESMLDSANSGPIDSTPTSEVSEVAEMRPLALHPRHGSIPSIRALRLTAEVTAKLRKRAQQEETTVHGALCAALVLAGRQVIGEWNDNPIRVVSPVDIRKLVGMGEHCGLFVSTTPVSFLPDAPTNFWELARFAKRQLAGAQTRDGVTPTIHAIQRSISKGLNVETASQFAAHGVAHGAVLTNLGNLRYQTSFGKFKLEALWGPAILRGFEGEPTIGTVTVNGSLHLLQTSHTPVPFLLERMERALLTACG
jgi:hypothetical protein